MTPQTITGINFENVTIGGNLTISGITVQNITQMVERPPLWVNVPILPREFVGRDALVAGLVARLTAGQSTALSAKGLPGVGKTALAVVLAHHPAILAHFADGVLWAGLGPQGDAMSALTAWGNALGVGVTNQPTVQLRSQAVRNAIGQRRLLLVIDDAWDLAAAEPLRCGGPGCAHLLTTRDQALARAFAGARHEVAMPELAEDPAFDLLRRLAPEACAADPATARRLAQAVGGLPLALELVGGFLAAPEHSLFPELSAEAWGVMADPTQRLQLATIRLGAIDGRQVTLQDTIALSLEHLPQPAVEAFYTLGAFAPKPAIFDLEAGKAVTEASAATLATLVARSLVEQAGPETLALHQTIADVTRTALSSAAIGRHRDHYLALVDEDREDWERIQAVYPQVQQALVWQVSRQPDDARLLDFYSFLHTYQERQGLWKDYAHLAGLCLTWAQTHLDHGNEATFFVVLGYMHNALGDKQQALAYYNQALPIKRQVGDRGGEAATLNNIGEVYLSLGDQRQALAYYNQAREIVRQIGDKVHEAATLNNIGAVYNALGDKQETLSYLNQALSLRRQVGDRAGESTTLNNIGEVYRRLGHEQQALDYHNQSLLLSRQVGDRAGEATTLNNIGLVYFALGDMRQVLDYFLQALPLRCQVGDRWGESITRYNITLVHEALGDLAGAEEQLLQVVALDAAIGHPDLESHRTALARIQAQRRAAVGA